MSSTAIMERKVYWNSVESDKLSHIRNPWQWVLYKILASLFFAKLFD